MNDLKFTTAEDYMALKVGDSFTLADIDLDALEKHAFFEHKLFIPCKKGRTDEQVYRDTYNGLAAERWLIEYHGYENIPEKYKDVKKDGVEVEVKTNTSDQTEESQLKALTERKKSTWANVPDHVISFRRKGDHYTVNRLMKWDGLQFVDNVV